ncbi:MAG: hypothetical protein R6V19_03090 [Armatimonadota bacterium]
MRLRYAAVVIALLVTTMLMGGCAIDPMEQLSADIQSQDITTRTRAIQEMANLNDPRTTDELIGVLEKDSEVADIAAVALVKKGREMEREHANGQQTNEIVEEVATIMNNPHLAQQFRARAAWTLGEIGSREAVAPLLTGKAATAGAAPADLVRKYATQALEKLGYYSEGRAFEIAMGELRGQVDVLKEPEPLTIEES